MTVSTCKFPSGVLRAEQMYFQSDVGILKSLCVGTWKAGLLCLGLGQGVQGGWELGVLLQWPVGYVLFVRSAGTVINYVSPPCMLIFLPEEG